MVGVVWTDVSARVAAMFNDEIFWEFLLSWLNWGERLSCHCMAYFAVKQHKAQSLVPWYNRAICNGNPQRMGSANLSNLSEYLLLEHWPSVAVFF